MIIIDGWFFLENGLANYHRLFFAYLFTLILSLGLIFNHDTYFLGGFTAVVSMIMMFVCISDGCATAQAGPA